MSLTNDQVGELHRLADSLLDNDSYAVVEAFRIGKKIKKILNTDSTPESRNLRRAYEVARSNAVKWNETLVSIEAQLAEGKE